MPINSAFKRSLLNCQPIMSASSKVVSTAFDKTDGYAGIATGFSSLTERQKGLEPRTIDNITLAGVSDFEGSETFSVDPQRPEIILISKLFEGDRNINQSLLKLRDFESSIDEADIKTIFDEILSNNRLKEALDKRIELDYQNRDKSKKILNSLSRLAFNIDDFRDSIDFIGSNKKIHEVGISNKSKIQSEFSEDPTGSSMSFKRTFLGLDDLSYVSNTTLIQSLLISLLLPGNIKFSNQNITSIQGSKFLLPTIQYDSTGDFLQFLAAKDIVDQNDFFEVESRLPKDAYARLALLSDSLSYELVTTAGLKKIERQNIFEILKNDIGPVIDVIRTTPQTNTIVSNFKVDDSLPFEIRKNIVDGVVYNGVLEKFIDPVISNASLDFGDLENFSKNVSSTMGSYLNVIETIRGIRTSASDNLKGYKLITKACEYINQGSSSILSNTRMSAQGLQLALLIETSKNNTSHGMRSRYSIFEKVLTNVASESNIVDRIRPRASAGTSRPIGSSNFLMNSGPFKNLLNQSTNTRPNRSRAYNSNSSNSDDGIISSLLTAAREAANRSTSRYSQNIQTKPQIIVATNLASNLLNNKIIKNKKNESKNAFAKIEKNIKEEINPSNIFVRETVKDILGTLALSINTNIFSTSKNSQYNEIDEEVSDLFTIKDSKIEEMGTSYATLEKFGVLLQDVYNRRNSSRTLPSVNPVIDISNSTVIRTKTIREKDRIKNKINKINLLTLGSLPVQKKRTIKLEKISTQNANVNSSISSNQVSFTGFDSAPNQNSSSNSRRERKIETKISVANKTAQASSTLYTNLRTKPQTNDSTITASVLFGTSLKQDVIKEHFRLISSNIGKKPIVSPVTRLEEIDPRTIDKVDTIDELFDLINSVKLLEPSQQIKGLNKKNIKTNLRKINLDFSASKKKSLSLSEGFNPINSINPRFSSFFNILLDGTNDNTNSLIFNSDINATLNQINSKNTITEKIDDFYDEISSTIDSYVGVKDVLESYTSNYQLDETKIKFIIFQIFMSILSLLQSTRMVRINSTYNSTNGFKVQSRISQAALKIELEALSTLANSKGSSSDIVTSGGITTNFSKAIKAISYCSISNDLILERYSIAKSFLDIYTTSVNSLISASKSQDIIETLNILLKIGNVELLKNLTQEYISSKQLLYSKVIDEAVSIKSTTRQIRIAKNILSNILLDKNEDVDVLVVGLPVKSIETLRRIDVKTNTNASLAGKEYIELEFSKRNVQFADMIPKPSKIRFSPRLEVIPQFSDALNLSGQIEDFIYLCYDESSWKTKNLNEAINFINKITGLSYIESTMIVMNHALDAICKLFFSSIMGLSFDEFIIGRKLSQISKEGYDFLNLLLNDENVSKVIPIGDMSTADCIEKNGNIYNIKTFSKLGKDVIDKTDQSTHRLFNLLLKDASFNTERLIEEFVKTNPFERVYCCVLNQDDYIFDKISSYSTKSGRTTVDGLLREKIILQQEEEIKFIEDNFTRRLDADEISVRINLVSN